MNTLGRLLMSQFWVTLASLAACGEWALWCWWRGELPPWPMHVGALLGLFALNRLACSLYEVEAHRAPAWHTLGQILLACGFTTAIGAGALAATAAVWLIVQSLGALPAEAGLHAEASRVWFGPAFDLVAGAVTSTAMAITLHGYLRGYRRLVVTALEVPLDDLPPTLDGLRIVHVSDLHVGPLAHGPSLRAALDLATRLRPDLVCVTGDLVDSRFADLARWMPELERLQASRGVFAILGNHDREAGGERVAAAVARYTRWRLLRDAVLPVDFPGGRLYVAGFEDRPLHEGRQALGAFLQTLPSDAPTVLLVHHPALFETAAGGAALVLAGHTHGGQVAVPGLPRLNPARATMTRFDAGTFRRNGSVLHVSRGLGTSGQRLRVAVPREITVLTLRTAATQAA